MGREVVYCDVCGIRLLQSEFGEGGAVTVKGRTYCKDCGKEAGVRATRPGTPRTPLRATPRPGTRRIPITRQQPTLPPQKNNTGVIIGVVVGVIAIGLLIAVSMSGGGNDGDSRPVVEKKKNGTDAEIPVTPAKKKMDVVVTDRTAEREATAKKAFEDYKAFAGKNVDNPQAVVDMAMKIMGDIDGTSFADAAAAIHKEAMARLQKNKAAKQVDEILLKIRDDIRGNDSFEDRAKIESSFNEALRLANGYAKNKVADIEEEQKNFRKALADAAKSRADRVVKRADELAADQRFDQAIEALDAYPEVFQDTASYTVIQEKRREIDGKLAALRNRPNLYTEFRRATTIMSRNDDYEGAYRIYTEVFEGMKNRALVRLQRITVRQAAQIRQIGNYNVACYHSKERSNAEESVKALRAAIEAGYRDWAHLDQDTDFDNVRNSKAYKDLMTEYRR